MSLQKKDPSLRVAANEPHLVSLGGGRLSTAVTIHNIPVGDCTIGTSSQCAVSLSGVGVKPIHCTIYRSEENQVTLVPEPCARILVDNCLIKSEIDLKQGAMITLGDSYYLRYNNPAEALQMRSVMKMIDTDSLDYFYDSNTSHALKTFRGSSEHSFRDCSRADKQFEFVDWQCPKVFSADLVTVNMPAKDVLGQKLETFTKYLYDKNSKEKNRVITIGKSDIVLSNEASKKKKLKEEETYFPSRFIPDNDQCLVLECKETESGLLKVCSEYADRQDRTFGCSGTTASSPIQNRIKTNGSLPRDKKSPYFQEHQFPNSRSTSLRSTSRYDSVHLVQEKSFSSKNYDLSEKYVKYERKHPLSNKETNFNNEQLQKYLDNSSLNFKVLTNTLKNFCKSEKEPIEENTKFAYNIIKPSQTSSEIAKGIDKNTNDITVDIKTFVSPRSSPLTLKKPLRITNSKDNSITTLFSDGYYDKWLKDRDDLLKRIKRLKEELSSYQKQDNETIIEVDIEQVITIAKLSTILSKKQKFQNELQFLQQTIQRLEAQRNSTRVMEENQQSKLKHSIEMKQNQIEKLQGLLKNNPTNDCLKAELSSVCESLESDKELFEDLEFQYLENETEWQAFREDLEEQVAKKQIEERKLSLELCEKEKTAPPFAVNAKQRFLSNRLIYLIRELRQCELQFKFIERNIFLKTCSNSLVSAQEEEEEAESPANVFQKPIKQFYSSQESLCSNTNNQNFISESANDKQCYNSQIYILRNELAKDDQKSKQRNMNSNESQQMCNEKHEAQQPSYQTELHHLDQRRREIEGILEKLNINISTSKLGAIQRDLRRSTDQLFRNEFPESESINISTPTSGSSFDQSSKHLINNTNNLSNMTNTNEFSFPRRCLTISYDYKVNQQQQKQQRPLTRFLPIFSDNFNLKEHIELSGHPISVCPHVFLNDYSCRGYLNKLGSTFHTWSKRWFVLDRRRSVFAYYADKSERKPRGGAHFSSINEVYIDHLNTSKSGRTHSTFVVKTKNKTYFLQASSDSAARIWIDVIITGAQGRVDY